MIKITGASPKNNGQKIFFGVPGGPRWASLVRICPRDHFTCRKKNYSVTNYFFYRVDFMISFVEIFALIFTQTA